MRLLTSTSSLFWGLQFALLNPALALVLVSVYGATGAQVGAVLAVYNGSGFLAAVLVPAWADRRGDYLRPMLACGVLGLALAAVLASTSSLIVAVAALAALGGPASAGSSLLFAHLKHSGARPRQVVNSRALFSVAWVAGPPVAALVMGAFGDGAVLFALVVVAALVVANTVVMLTHRPAPSGRSVAGTVTDGSEGGWPRRSVTVVIAAFVALQTANTAAVAAMGLFVTERLGLPIIWAGVALGVAAALEIPALLLIGRLTSRVSSLTLLVTGCAAGIGYGLGMAVVGGPVGLLAMQVLNAWFVAVVAGAGLTLFQSMIARPGLASGTYSNTFRLGAVLSGPLLGWASTSPLGYGGVFAGCAAVTVPALVAIVLVGRGRRAAPDATVIRLTGAAADEPDEGSSRLPT